jgi:hypothetical protein
MASKCAEAGARPWAWLQLSGFALGMKWKTRRFIDPKDSGLLQFIES